MIPIDGRLDDARRRRAGRRVDWIGVAAAPNPRLDPPLPPRDKTAPMTMQSDASDLRDAIARTEALVSDAILSTSSLPALGPRASLAKTPADAVHEAVLLAQAGK